MKVLFNHSVRGARAKDMPAVASLARIVWLKCYPGIISSAQIHYMLKRMYDVNVLIRDLRSGVYFDLWFRDEQLAGFSSYGPIRGAWPVKIHKLYVHPDYQRMGGGRTLLNQAEKNVRNHNGPSLYLTVNKRNHPAIRAYRKHGFQLGQSVVVDIGGDFVMDDYKLVKQLI